MTCSSSALDADRAASMLSAVSRTMPRPTPVKLPRREALVPESEQLCGPYGPRFVGYGPPLPVPLKLRLLPYALGAMTGLAGLALAAIAGKF